MLGRRAAVTGIGVVAPAGIGKDAFWAACSPCAQRLPAGRRLGPNPLLRQSEGSSPKRPGVQFTLAAAAEALEQAGEISADPARRAPSSVPASAASARSKNRSRSVFPRASVGSPVLVPMMMANARPPPSRCVTAGRAHAKHRDRMRSGTHAIGNAARMVADGRCDVVMAGGAEAPFTPTRLPASAT